MREWCLADALTYEEREEEVEEEARRRRNSRSGWKSLADKYGLAEVMDTVARLSKKELNITGRNKRTKKAMETVPPSRKSSTRSSEAGGEAFKFCYQCG